jgi:hypothetical protein
MGKPGLSEDRSYFVGTNPGEHQPCPNWDLIEGDSLKGQLDEKFRIDLNHVRWGATSVVQSSDALHRSVWWNSKLYGPTGVANLNLLQQVANRGWQLFRQVGQGSLTLLCRDSLFAHT